jgi:hypothetical protein
LINENCKQLTILTKASDDSNEHKWLSLKTRLKKIINLDFSTTQNPGHAGVVRSLCDGLTKLNIPYQFNPKKEIDIQGTVIVLSGHDALSQCIRLKKNNKIEELYAGPNLVVSPKEAPDLFNSKYVDYYITNSEWVKNFYIHEAAHLKNKLIVWPSGTDIDFWKNDNENKKDKFIVYKKHISNEKNNEVHNFLKDKKIDIEEIIYGQYDINTFKEKLSKAKALIYLTSSESQGLALQECWSMNVPTFILKYCDFIHNGELYASSPAPYLTSECGELFTDHKELNAIVDNLKNKTYNPRKWVEENASDQISAKHILSIINFL